MRLRQLVFVSKERDRLAKEICDVFELKEAYNDPGLINFGLKNVLIPLNDTFFEIVMPVQENTTAERFFDKTGGEGGYMIIVDVENFEKENDRIKNSKIKIIWNGDRKEENIHARTIHLHPKQVGGAILSLDKMIPEDEWLWAGTNWKKHINKSIVDSISGVILKSRDPDKLCSQWELALGKKRDSGEIFNISLDQSNISFVHDKNSIEDGIHAFIVKALNREKIIENAKLKGLLVNEEITVGGVKIILD